MQRSLSFDLSFEGNWEVGGRCRPRENATKKDRVTCVVERTQVLEMEADWLGILALARAAYDPEELMNSQCGWSCLPSHLGNAVLICLSGRGDKMKAPLTDIRRLLFFPRTYKPTPVVFLLFH